MRGSSCLTIRSAEMTSRAIYGTSTDETDFCRRLHPQIMHCDLFSKSLHTLKVSTEHRFTIIETLTLT